MLTCFIMNSSEYLEALNWRYACKKFDSSRQIPEDTWETLEESLRLSPSSVGLQLWHFLVIDTPELRGKLREISWNQSQVTDSSRYLILCARRDAQESDVASVIESIKTVRNPSPETLAGTENFMLNYVRGLNPAHKDAWIEAQVHIALGFIASAAAVLRVDTCIIGGMDRIACDDMLGLTNSPYRSVVGIALGYRSKEDGYAQLPKVRFTREQTIRHL